MAECRTRLDILRGFARYQVVVRCILPRRLTGGGERLGLVNRMPDVAQVRTPPPWGVARQCNRQPPGSRPPAQGGGRRCAWPSCLGVHRHTRDPNGAVPIVVHVGHLEGFLVETCPAEDQRLIEEYSHHVMWDYSSSRFGHPHPENGMGQTSLTGYIVCTIYNVTIAIEASHPEFGMGVSLPNTGDA